MKLVRALLIGAAGLALFAPLAGAVDAPPATIAPTVVATPPPMGFDWNGAYLGAGGGGVIAFPAAFDWGRVNIQAGVNRANGRMVLGAELQFGVGFDGGGYGLFFEGNGRAGALLGNVLLYAEGGVGFWFGPGGCCTLYWNAGGGAEVPLGDAVTAFVEAKAHSDFGAIWVDLRIEGGLNWHLGR